LLGAVDRIGRPSGSGSRDGGWRAAL